MQDLSMEKCVQCGSRLTLDTENVPAPHYGRVVCLLGHFVRWAAHPMTYGRAAQFVMPFGKYRGSTLAEIDRADHPYLVWAAHEISSPSVKRAIICFVSGPDPESP
jgi:uncharacterized protein (DUF3820 family)